MTLIICVGARDHCSGNVSIDSKQYKPRIFNVREIVERLDKIAVKKGPLLVALQSTWQLALTVN